MMFQRHQKALLWSKGLTFTPLGNLCADCSLDLDQAHHFPQENFRPDFDPNRFDTLINPKRMKKACQILQYVNGQWSYFKLNTSQEHIIINIYCKF